MGEFQQAASNETATGRAENRRVEVKILVNKGIAGSNLTHVSRRRTSTLIKGMIVDVGLGEGTLPVSGLTAHLVIAAGLMCIPDVRHCLG